MKVINLYKMKIKKLKSGGGAPKLKTPTSIENLKKIENELKMILSKTIDRVVIILFHKDNTIPAISNRFTKSMKVIFGSNVLKYEKNTINDKGKLGFHYDVSNKQLEIAIERLEVIINFLEDEIINNSTSIEEWFNDIQSKKNEKFIDNINKKLKKSIDNISKTSLMELVSRAEENYFEIISKEIIGDEDFKFDENNFVLASFVSAETAKSACDLLKKNGAKINYYNGDIIEYKIQKNIDLYGLIKKENSMLKLNRNINNTDSFDEDEVIFNHLESGVKENNIRVGVIDGGIPENSIVRKKIIYHNFKTLSMGYENLEVSQDTHAEKVCSMILWANNLSDRTKDNCSQPNVTLFDVWSEELSAWEYLDIITKIVKKYHKEIRIWNLSSVFLNSRNDKSWNHGVSNLAIQFDDIQKKYNVLFIIATGNNENNNNDDVIMSPSDSVRAISVSACGLDFKPLNYSLNGQSKVSKYFLTKPDIVTTGCDSEGYFKVISNNKKTNSIGVSFAVPLITRKVAELAHEGVELNMIPAILIAIATDKNVKGLDNYLGNGYIPMDIKEITELKDTSAMILFSLTPEHYSQGFFEIELPKDENNNYPYSFAMGVNVEAKTSGCESFEYIEDTVRVQLGAVDPIIDIEKDNAQPKLLQHTKISIINGDDDDSFKKEESLRQYYGKYKNRYCSKRISKRAISGKRVSPKHSSEIFNIDKFGFTLTRNDIRSERKGKVTTHVCLIVKNINEENIYNEIRFANKNIVNNIIDLEIDKSNDIKFE